MEGALDPDLLLPNSSDPVPCTSTGAELFALRAAQVCIGVDDRSHFIASSESKGSTGDAEPGSRRRPNHRHLSQQLGTVSQ